MSPVNGSQKRWTEMEAGSSDHSLEKDVTLQGQEALLVGSNLKASGGHGCPPWLWVWSNEKTKQNPHPSHLLALILDLSQNIITKL